MLCFCLVKRFVVDGFLEREVCERLIQVTSSALVPSPVVGAGDGVVSSDRTSSTCFLAREDVPTIVQRVCAITGKPADETEVVQVGRYAYGQEYKAHFDAFDLSTEDGRRFAMNGGQRVGTCLIYLNDVEEGGETHFPLLDLSIRPEAGKLVVFFPAELDGRLDEKALHAALPAVQEKWVSQVWIRQSKTNGIPTLRLEQPI
jgi:prolyl 4-hydroxylase